MFKTEPKSLVFFSSTTICLRKFCLYCYKFIDLKTSVCMHVSSILKTFQSLFNITSKIASLSFLVLLPPRSPIRHKLDLLTLSFMPLNLSFISLFFILDNFFRSIFLFMFLSPISNSLFKVKQSSEFSYFSF